MIKKIAMWLLTYIRMDGAKEASMKAIFLLSLIVCGAYAADEYQMIHSNLPVLQDITEYVLSLPGNDMSILFLKYLIYQSPLCIFELPLDQEVTSLTEPEAAILTFFAGYFDWHEVMRSIHDHNIKVEILPEQNEMIQAYFDQHCLTLRYIDIKMRTLPEDTILKLWLGLLIFEFEKKGITQYGTCELLKKRVLDWFQENVPQNAVRYCKHLATQFNLSGILGLLHDVPIDDFMIENLEAKKRRERERYFSLWKTRQGEAGAIQVADFPADGISCGDMFVYGKKYGCLHYFIRCKNDRSDYTINLSYQRLDTLDGVEHISTPEQCSSFLADHNCIAMVPSLDKLCNLTTLSLSHNYLAIFPSVLKKLKYLQRLILNNNQIQIFPTDVSGFDALKELNLSHNNIREFPEKVAGFKRLKRLEIERNAIRSVPCAVQGLESVRHLYLSGNSIKACPLVIKGMEGLETFHI